MKTDTVKTALVVGGGSGLGYAAAQALCRGGIKVFLADIQPVSAAALENDFGGLDGGVASLSVDVSDSRSVSALFLELRQRTPRLDMLVHAAGILGETAFIEDIDDRAWRRMMAVNLDGVFFCCREAIRWMKVERSGRILLFSSVAATTPTPGALPYSTAKSGVTMMGKTLAREVARYNIRINIIAPGYIATPMLEKMPDEFLDHIIRKTPLKRLGEPEEIAALVSYLASASADFFTGQVFTPNGGLVI
jgi:NAD(P)-dependent dehydrogenase (short-subunit alcohol dehydrogenase family)